MRELANSMIDLVLGRTCAGCDKPGVGLCGCCARALQPRVRLRRDLDVGDVVEGLRIPVVCALDYRGIVRHVLYRYKDHRIRQLARVLGPALGASVTLAADRAGVPARVTVLTPMPTRRSSLRRRGFDATALLASESIKHVTTSGIRHLLVDTRIGGAAKHVGAFERERRAVDAFRLKRERALPTTPVILVDDIVTTGSTVKEAVETLLVAGVQVVAVATLAGTP